MDGRLLGEQGQACGWAVVHMRWVVVVPWNGQLAQVFQLTFGGAGGGELIRSGRGGARCHHGMYDLRRGQLVVVVEAVSAQ